ALGDEGRHVTPKPAGAPLVGGVSGDIGPDQIGEGAVAEIGVNLLVVLAENLGEPRHIGVAIDAEKNLAFFLGAVVDLGEDRVVAGENAALKFVLDVLEAFHSAATREGACALITSPAICRA